MLSNPVHVDQIEKQQRVKTPQDGKNSPNGYQIAGENIHLFYFCLESCIH